MANILFSPYDQALLAHTRDLLVTAETARANAQRQIGWAKAIQRQAQEMHSLSVAMRQRLHARRAYLP